ncbi:Highly reducing polyketide synthase gloL [Metarhizium anisopliae]|nr:Highly reducing polyketide synthase gloL [Metarhizium anisopliae]
MLGRFKTNPFQFTYKAPAPSCLVTPPPNYAVKGTSPAPHAILFFTSKDGSKSLLGNRIVETAANEPVWRNSLALEDVPWLAGHEVNGQIVLPAAGYIAMVGEALLQLHEVADESHETTFSIKNLHIASARILKMNSTVELITSLKPIMIDASETTAWYQFAISSFDGTRWMRNCFGETRVFIDKSFTPPCQVGPQNASFPRIVDEKACTDNSDQSQSHRGYEHSTQYVLHPSVIDQCFQLFTVASCRGIRRNISQVSVPTFIEEIVVCPCPTSQTLSIVAHVDNALERGSFTGNLVAQSAEGDERPTTTCIGLKGLKTSALTSRSDRDADEEEMPLITQLEWMPHSDFADLGSRFRRPAPRVMEWPLLEELTLLCMLDHDEGIETNGKTAKHLVKFSVWTQQQIENYKQGTNKFVDKNKRLEEKSAEQRLERIKEIMAILSSSPYAILAKAVDKLFSVAPAIFSGETHPLHILMEDHVLAEFYDALSMDSADLLKLLANTNPHMRILEVGAGRGGTTARVLRALTSSYGECLYSVYTYTDVSAGFIPAAKQRFANHEKIEYAVLDVAADTAQQGFQPGSYDLIIAANVIYATPYLNETLGNMRNLLRFGGGGGYSWKNSVLGFLHGWWLGAQDNRVDQPYVSPERWTKELLHAGFSKPEVIVLDDSAPYHVNTGILVSRESRHASLLAVSVLCHSPNSPYVSEMHQCLESLDVAVNICHFGQELPAHNDIISLLDLEVPVLHEMTEETFDTIKEYLSSHKAKILWVTPASQVGDVKDPRAAMVLGLVRTVRNERSLPFFTIEVDETTTSAVAAASAHAGSEQPNNRESIDPDYEYAIIKGEVLVPRLHRQTISEAFQSTQRGDDCETDDLTTDRHITMEMPGLLHTMTWSKGGSSRSPADGDIVVETRAVGLNFRDVLIALGIIENSPSEMGFEGSGVVRAVGPGVSRFSISDHVMYLGSGCFKTIHTVNAALRVKMDDSMSFEQGAALPCVYTTALMALVDKADLKCGQVLVDSGYLQDAVPQSVLIHAACGGVGLAAIQIAKMLGAQIYCTVGSDVKRNHLAENYGIPPSHIFNSRDSSFLPDVLRATDGRGVDVVLNSLPGDLL